MKRTIPTYLLVFFCFLFSFDVLVAQADTSKMFIFGHSLLDHRPPLISTPSDETTVPHWMFLLSQDAGNYYEAGGKYGFLPQHAMLPPFAQWGYDIVPGVWDSDYETWVEAEINTVLLTAGNFMQWQGPNEEYPGDQGVTPVSASEEILDWVSEQDGSTKIYIYENWPDMAPYISGDFPPNTTEFINYAAYTNGEFHDWWIEYQDALLDSRPDINVRMIPVGPILMDIMIDILGNTISYEELFEDNAPHGRASTYFLAALITYSAVYAEPAPGNFTVPDIIHPDIQTNYQSIVDFIWDELQNFNFADGESRVFCPNEEEADQVFIRLFLEGSYLGNGLMSTSLVEEGVLPINQPFDNTPLNYSGNESLINPVADNIVDWVLVELRDPNDPFIVLSRQAALLRNDGMLINSDGEEGLTFPNVSSGSYYVAIYQRSHLAVLSASTVGIGDGSFYDFTSMENQAWGVNQVKPMQDGSFAMYSGDYDSNGIINNLDFNLWFNDNAATQQYLEYDGDLNGYINNLDYNIWYNNRSKVGASVIQF